LGKKATQLTFGDLFGGAGGISVGFHNAGYKSVFFNEINKTAGATHSLNFPESVPFVCPIQDLTAQKIMQETGLKDGDLDVMVGGPPCQGFSINAPIRSVDDARNSLFHNYVRLVLEGLRPKFIVMENVPGLISFNNGQSLADVQAAFENAGYRVIFKILNAAHYGVPEERWRLFFIGTRLPGVELSMPMPTHYSLQRTNFTGGKEYTFRHAIGNRGQDDLFQALKDPTTVRDAIDDLPPLKSGGGIVDSPYEKEATSEYQKLMRKGSHNIFNHECAAVAQINLDRLKHVKPGGSWRDIPFELLPKGLQRARRSDHTKRYGRLDPKGMSGTILTKCDPHWGTFFHYKQNRIISVREAARIQSFPDWFKFTGSKTEQYRDVGNAVPPLLAQTIAAHIQKMYEASLEKPVAPKKSRSEQKIRGDSLNASL